ncbi:class I SAM-dependent methyltransferase [Pelagibacterales bacterium SAG-MED33]|nr:class I SAM-dependent methyltransferase [Pelagibacterales bacterium SAG-MED33]
MSIFKAYNYLIESEDKERLKKIFVRYELFKKSQNIPGDIIECGVFKGTGHLFWLKLLDIFDHNSIKKVIGFDTFKGFPKSVLKFEQKEAKKFVKESNYSRNTLTEVNKKISRAGLNARSVLIKGDIIKTSKSYIKKNRGFRISLLHLDLDTYEGTKHVLNNFFPLVSKKGIVVFDEYGSRGWGESEAIDEYFHDKKYSIIKTENSTKPTAYLIKK